MALYTPEYQPNGNEVAVFTTSKGIIKAKLDGEYVEKMSFGFDCKCFFGTVKSVLKSDGVVEGGTGELEKQKKEQESAEAQNKEEK